MTSSFIKASRIKYINPHIFGYTQDLTEFGQKEVRKIKTSHNIADMLTKALPTYKYKKLVHDAGMRSFHKLIPSRIEPFS